MNRYLSVVMLIVFVSSTLLLESCLKKGPNDPFVSFKTRKARMTGEWIIKDYLYETTTDYIDGRKDIYKFTSTNDAVSETIGYANVNGIKDTTWTWNGKIVTERMINFDKNGKVTLKYNYKLSEFYEDVTEAPTIPFDDKIWWADTTITIERKYYNTGTWNFLNNIDDYKNKERITIMWDYWDFEQINNIKVVYRSDNEDTQPSQEINESSRTQSRSYFYNGENTETWVLDKLKNKEIFMYRYLDNNFKESVSNSETANTSIKGYESYELEQE